MAGPRPGRGGRGEPEDHLVPDRHRQPGARRRPRLRPTRTQEPEEPRRPGPPPGETGFSFTPAGRDGPPGGYGTWRLTTPGDGPDLIITIDPLTTDPCDHRHEANGHDPGVKLRHLAQIRHATCTSPVCRRPAAQATSSTTSPTRRAAGRACVTPARSAVMTIGSSSTPGGRWTSFPTGPSGGPPRPAAATTPNPPATRSKRGRGARKARVTGLGRIQTGTLAPWQLR